jgi:hypothetical protein
MPLTSVAGVCLFFEEILNVIRESNFFCTRGTKIEALRSPHGLSTKQNSRTD